MHGSTTFLTLTTFLILRLCLVQLIKREKEKREMNEKKNKIIANLLIRKSNVVSLPVFNIFNLTELKVKNFLSLVF